MKTSAPGTEKRSRIRGFTVVEMVFTLSVGIVVVGASAASLGAFQESFREFSTRNIVRTTGDRLSQRMNEELRLADPSTITPILLFASDTISFDPIDGGAVQPRVTIAFQLVPTETANGLDDNGDGRADEGVVTRTQNGISQILAEDVIGFRIFGVSEGLLYQIDVGRIGDRGLVQQQFSSRVRFRNEPAPPP